MSVNILIRFSDAQAEALAAERKRTGCSVSKYVRRAVAVALEPKTERSRIGRFLAGESVPLTEEKVRHE
jgi:hypothetical protein